MRSACVLGTKEVSKEDWQLLSTVYDDPYDIDLYVGQLVEKPYKDSIVGKTSLCLLGEEIQS